MTYVITSPCIDVKDQSCVQVCPVDCIHHEEGVDRMLFINPEECIDCGACEPVCPVTAIYPEEAVPEDQRELITSTPSGTGTRPPFGPGLTVNPGSAGEEAPRRPGGDGQGSASRCRNSSESRPARRPAVAAMISR